MTVIRFHCDRCNQYVEGTFTASGTAGFYDVSQPDAMSGYPGGSWKAYGSDNETFVCDDCVHVMPEYQAVYGTVPEWRVEKRESMGEVLARAKAMEQRYKDCWKALDDLISLDKGLERIAASEENGCVDMRVTIDAHTAAVNAVELALWEPRPVVCELCGARGSHVDGCTRRLDQYLARPKDANS